MHTRLFEIKKNDIQASGENESVLVSKTIYLYIPRKTNAKFRLSLYLEMADREIAHMQKKKKNVFFCFSEWIIY